VGKGTLQSSPLKIVPYTMISCRLLQYDAPLFQPPQAANQVQYGLRCPGSRVCPAWRISRQL